MRVCSLHVLALLSACIHLQRILRQGQYSSIRLSRQDKDVIVLWRTSLH